MTTTSGHCGHAFCTIGGQHLHVDLDGQSIAVTAGTVVGCTGHTTVMEASDLAATTSIHTNYFRATAPHCATCACGGGYSPSFSAPENPAPPSAPPTRPARPR